MELEGFEPSSKRGTNVLSTCVVADWFSSDVRPGQPNASLASEDFVIGTRLASDYFRYISTAFGISLGKRAIGRCLVSLTVREIKLIYCASIRQRERSCFRHLKRSRWSSLKRLLHHGSARLRTASTRCQNRSAPLDLLRSTKVRCFLRCYKIFNLF